MGFHANYLMNLAVVAMGRQPVRPLLFSYYLTHRCPMNCRYCSDGAGNPFKETVVEELGTEAAKNLVTMLSRAADTLDVTGGEPMVRHDLEEILAHARRCGMRTALNTKGIGLASRPELMRTDVLVLSVDALESAKLSELHGGTRTSADQVLEAMEFALKWRCKTKTQVVLSAVATPDNLEGAQEVLEFAVRNRVGFHLSPQIVGVRAHPGLIGNEDYRRLIEAVIEKKKAGGGVLGIETYLMGIRDFSPFRCHPLLMPVIRPDGKLVYPCLERPEAQVNVVESGGYREAIPACGDCCHIFCHMALSLLQRHPLQALNEGRRWMAIQAGCEKNVEARE